MKKFLVLYLAPVRVVDAWKATPAEKRQADEQKMMNEWRTWMGAHARMFADPGAGVGKTRRVTAQGAAETRNDVMLYAIVEAESQDAAAQAFVGHPHLQIPESSIEIMEIHALPPQ
jgi:hypothetical protein